MIYINILIFLFSFTLDLQASRGAAAGGGAVSAARDHEETSRMAMKVIQRLGEDYRGQQTDFQSYLEMLAELHARGMAGSFESAFVSEFVETLSKRPDFLFEQECNSRKLLLENEYLVDIILRNLATDPKASQHESLKLVLQRRIQHVWQRDKRRMDDVDIITTDPERAHKLSQYNLAVSQSSQRYHDFLLGAALALLPACKPEEFDKQTILLLELDFGLQNLLTQKSIEDIAANSGHPDDAFSELTSAVQFSTVAAKVKKKLLSGPWNRKYEDPKWVMIDALSAFTIGWSEAPDGTVDIVDFHEVDAKACVRSLKTNLERATESPHREKSRIALRQILPAGTFFDNKRLQRRFLTLLGQRLEEDYQAICFSEAFTSARPSARESDEVATLESSPHVRVSEVPAAAGMGAAAPASEDSEDVVTQTETLPEAEDEAHAMPVHLAALTTYASSSAAPREILLPLLASRLSSSLQRTLSTLLNPETRSIRYDDFVTLWEHFAGEGSVQITRGSHGRLMWSGHRVGSIVRPHPVPVLGPNALKSIRQILIAVESRL